MLLYTLGNTFFQMKAKILKYTDFPEIWSLP